MGTSPRWESRRSAFPRTWAISIRSRLWSMRRSPPSAASTSSSTAPPPLALPLGHLTEEAWSKSLDTNLRGPAFLVERALPHLEASGNAAVLNIISAAAFLFNPHGAMYSAGKAAFSAHPVDGRSVCPERHPVNALAPGTVMTDMVMNNPPEAVESMQQAAFMRRGADPDEMVGPAAAAVLRRRQFHHRPGADRGRRPYAALGVTPCGAASLSRREPAWSWR